MGIEVSAVISRLRKDLASLVREATEIRRLAHGAQPKYYMSLYALLMGVFSQVDLLSTLWRGTRRDQTARMGAFLERYTDRGPEAIRLAIQLYRHTLMHTGRPRELLDRSTRQHHYFLLHWGREAADESAHMTVDERGNLTLNLECLLEDVVRAFDHFAAEVESDDVLTDRVRRAWSGIALQEFG